MTRDKAIFLAVLILFASVNIALLINDDLQMDWEGLGIMVAAGLTLALYSFLYKDNPFFKMAENLFVGVAAAYVFGQYWYPTIYGEIWVRLIDLSQGEGDPGDVWLLVPTLLGLLMLTRFSRRFSWLSRLSFAFFVGLGAGLTIPRTISSFILAQVEATLQPLSWSLAGLDLLVILMGVVSVLVYFFFSLEHKGVVGKVSRLGIAFLMISFGASFGYTIMARLSLLIGRISFLMDDWLHLL
ncbi:MAG: hypothetical protein VX294_07060 [Candidatus Latescibacterota bacterium]|nr:hypothetical protein [Candidatus Latescibacterota bacterium]